MDSKSADCPVLLLTGQKRGKRHLVMLRGAPVGLSPALFNVLCELAAQAVADPHQPLRLKPQRVCRLRAALDHGAIDSQRQRVPIASYAGAMYALSVDARDLAVELRFLQANRAWRTPLARLDVRAM